MNTLNNHHVKTLPILEPLEADLQRVLDKMRAAAHVEMALLDEALAYVVAVGGKLIRPALALTANGIYRPTDDRALALAASVEMLHTATLVHDDMVDQAARRRGNPTLHTMLDPGSAVLLGDYLFAQAASWAAATESVRVVQIFSNTLMTIVGGELRQMWARFDLERANEDYFGRIHGKTAALFAAACEAGAVLGRAPEREIHALREFGRLFGLAFQIVDDVLDFVGDPDRMGKPVGSDLHNGNITLPTILYLRRYDREGLAGRYFGAERLTPAQADEMVSRVLASSALGDSLSEARRLVEEAKERLHALPASDEVERLCALADYTIERTL